MDTVTHGLTGWLVSRALPPGIRNKAATAAVVAGSVLPDADHVATFFGGETYVRMHRGISHSFAGVAVTSLLLALVLCLFGKGITWKDRKELGILYLLALAGQLSHIALDLLNSYGTQVLQPFSDARVSFDILFVVDLAFTGIVLLGILWSRRGPRPARAALAGLGLYVALATGLHFRAEDAVRAAAARDGIRVVSVAALPRLAEVPVDEGLAAFRLIRVAWAGENMRALPVPDRPGKYPFPAGPFAWNGFVDDGKSYLRAEVGAVTGRVEWVQRVRRGMDLPEVKAVEALPDVRTYLWFARFPVVQAASEGGRVVLTFSDLRFGGIPRKRHPFLLRVIDAPGKAPEARWG